MNPLSTLAHYVREAARVETYEGLAKRCGLPSRKYIHRAIHPNREHSNVRHYNPVLSAQVCKLLDGLGLTIAPVDDSVPSVADVCMMIGRMNCHPVAKSMAIDAVHRAGQIREDAA